MFATTLLVYEDSDFGVVRCITCDLFVIYLQKTDEAWMNLLELLRVPVEISGSARRELRAC